MQEDLARILEVVSGAEQEIRDRTLPDGGHITFYEQVFNWKVTYTRAEDWPDFWEEAY